MFDEFFVFLLAVVVELLDDFVVFGFVEGVGGEEVGAAVVFFHMNEKFLEKFFMVWGVGKDPDTVLEANGAGGA